MISNGTGTHTHMPAAIVYVDTAEVREGSLEDLKAAVEDLVDFIESNEPRLIAYNVYFSDDGTRMTVVHMHPDPASLEYHRSWQARCFAGSPTSSPCRRSTSKASRAKTS